MSKKNEDYFDGRASAGTSGLSLNEGKDRIFDLLGDYTAAYIPFHMPGHKRSAAFDFLAEWQKYDITETDKFDNLNDARGIIRESEKLAAKVFGVRELRYLVNGGTSGILASVHFMTRREDKIVLARNCHKSVYNAVELCGLKPVYVLPKLVESGGFCGSVSVDSVKDALKKNPETKLVVITSPSYEGIISDVKGIADVVHSFGAMLLVDEAHGAHLGLHPYFEKSARELGADVVVNSFHKTLPSLNQTAAVSVCTSRADAEELDKSISVFQTSSPSYPLIASMDGAVRFVSEVSDLDGWTNALKEFYSSIKLNALTLFRSENSNTRSDPKIYAFDKSKIVVLTNGFMTGTQLCRRLKNDYFIEAETAGLDYAVFMTGAGDNVKSLSVLASALEDLDCRVSKNLPQRGFDPSHECVRKFFSGEGNLVIKELIRLPEIVFNPYEIRALNTESVEIEKSVGKVSAEYVWAYPPGAPVIAAGENVSAETLGALSKLYESGITVSSTYRGFPHRLRVVKN